MLSDEEKEKDKDADTLSAEKLLQRTNIQVEKEDWAKIYVEDMKENVLNARQQLKLEKDKMGYLGALLRSVRGSEKDKNLKAELSRKAEEINKKEVEIKEKYQKESREREAKKTIDQVPQNENLTEEERQVFFKKIMKWEERNDRYNIVYSNKGVFGKAATYVVSDEEYKAIGNELDNIKRGMQVAVAGGEKAANKIINKIPGSNRLSKEQREKLVASMVELKRHGKQNEGKAEIDKQDENVQRIILKEINRTFVDEVKKELEEIISEKFPQFSRFSKESEGLAKDLKRDLGAALLDQRRKEAGLPLISPEEGIEFVEMKIRIAGELEEIKNFKKMDLETKIGYIANISNHIKALKEAQKDEDKDLEKKEIKEIVSSVKGIFENFKEKDKEFGVDEHWITDTYDKGKKKLYNIVSDPRVQGALVGGLFGMGAGSWIPGYGTAAGAAIGAVAGFKNPGLRHVLRPFKFLYNEIVDIVNKPKAYIDRIFRGGMIAGSAGGATVGIALAAAALGLSNPFSGGIIIGAVSIVGVCLAAAAAAKLAKVISKKVSEMRYGIYNPDRYELTKEAKKFFGEDLANEIREYFIKEIREIQKRVSAIDDKNSDRAKNLLANEYELESTWNQIKLGNEKSLTAWEDCSRHLYQEKKNEYEARIGIKIGKSKNEEKIINVLLHIADPSLEKSPEKSGEKAFPDKPAPTHLAFLYGKNKKGKGREPTPTEILEGIEKLEKVNRLINNNKIKPKPKLD